jgi:hypothetical protein
MRKIKPRRHPAGNVNGEGDPRSSYGHPISFIDNYQVNRAVVDLNELEGKFSLIICFNRPEGFVSSLRARSRPNYIFLVIGGESPANRPIVGSCQLVAPALMRDPAHQRSERGTHLRHVELFYAFVNQRFNLRGK